MSEELEKPETLSVAPQYQLVQIVKELSKVARKGPTILLLTLGSTLIVIPLLMKLEILGQKVSNVTPSEFITMIVAAIILLAFGSFLRVYQEKTNAELAKAERAYDEGIVDEALEEAQKRLGKAKTPRVKY